MRLLIAVFFLGLSPLWAEDKTTPTPVPMSAELSANIMQRTELLRGMINLHVEYCLESEQMEVLGKLVFIPLKDEKARARATGANTDSYFKKDGPDWTAIAACVKTIPDACEGQKQGKIASMYDGERCCSMKDHREKYFKLFTSLNTFLDSKL